jgi:hypothetical protein
MAEELTVEQDQAEGFRQTYFVLTAVCRVNVNDNAMQSRDCLRWRPRDDRDEIYGLIIKQHSATARLPPVATTGFRILGIFY